MKKLLVLTLSTIVGLFVFMLAHTAEADTPHTLIVDGQEYQSTKEAGASIHWETPDTDPSSASFPERGQIWDGNGYDHLPCPGGIHWISNYNNLTISHCLDYATTSSTQPVATTAAPTTVSSTSTTGAPTTTVPESTSTSSPTTSTEPSSTTTVPDSTPTSTQAPTSTSSSAAPTTSAAATTTSPSPVSQPLPPTGSSEVWAVWAGALVILGGATLFAARRRP